MGASVMNLLVWSSRSTVMEKSRCCRTRIPANSDSEAFQDHQRKTLCRTSISHPTSHLPDQSRNRQHVSQREQVSDFWRCFDRQLLMLFRGRCLQESRGDITKMDTKFVQCACLKYKKRDIFPSVGAAVGTFVSSGC